MLRLRTLGGLSLENDAREVGGAALQKRRLALLAALAIGGPRGFTREKLLGLLWTDADEARGRGALSQSLYALRRDTGEEDLVLGSDVLRLNPDVITTDLADFETALARNELEMAASAYDGPFLDGVYVSDTDEFDRWADLERVRLARAAERAIEKLALVADANSDHRAAADWWRRLVVIDPLKTRANLALVSALAASGERVNARQALQAYTARLRADLDAEPGAEVQALAEELRHARAEPGDDAVDDRFVLERELGRGGMAVVYLARDRKHDRPVALKMLHPEFGAAVGRDRLEREILVTARLQHPHILPLHDSGEHGGTLYYVMPYVDGGSLRDRLTRERQLPLGDALRIAREIADALDHAHRRGVVHRDIKPENVLLGEDHAFVADFGIARLVLASLEEELTQQGIALGTPAYMSPEQMTGDIVGAASDLFSLGCVLFEMLAGRPPWIAANVQALLARRFTEVPPPLRAIRPDLPAWIDEVVHRLLVEDPASRLSSAAELVRLLGDTTRHAPSRLPTPLGNLIGRAREVDAASALLTNGDVRLVTFTGAGGSGKTRLALKTAAHCGAAFEAMYFVDLSAVLDPSAVEATIADVLQVQPTEGMPAAAALAAHIGSSRILLILDNFEQIVTAAPVISRLLAACPHLSALVTSRRRLGVRGEHEFFVAPLAVHVAGTSESGDDGMMGGVVSPAVELFLSRAREAHPGYVVDPDGLAAVTAICVRLDGLPLAIELAAARCRIMTPAAILGRLEKGFELLAGGTRDMPERHQTMRHAIEWSHGLLSAPQQDLFARLAVFVGGCTLSAVEQVCIDDTLGIDVIAGTEALLDASFLMRDDGIVAASDASEPRFRMLETVRELALERLHAAPDELAARMLDRHRAWALAFAASFGGQLTGQGQRNALATLGAEHANLVSAFTRTVTARDAIGALTMVDSIWRYWLVRRGLSEGRELIERALALQAPSEADALRANAMLGAGQLAQNNGDVASAGRYFAEVLAIRRRLGDKSGEARALADLGWLAWRRCDFVDARRRSEECLSLARGIGSDGIAALALGNLGFVNHCEGALSAAVESFQAAVAIRERLADRRGVAFMRTAMAWTMCRAGDLIQARAVLDVALAVHRELRDERLEAFALNVLVDVTLRSGDVSTARGLLARTLPSMRRIGDRWSIAHALWLSARADVLEGNARDAWRSASESLELRRQIDDRYGEAESIVAQVHALVLEARLDEALALLRQARMIRVAIGDRLGIVECDALLLNASRVHVGVRAPASLSDPIASGDYRQGSSSG